MNSSHTRTHAHTHIHTHTHTHTHTQTHTHTYTISSLAPIPFYKGTIHAVFLVSGHLFSNNEHWNSKDGGIANEVAIFSIKKHEKLSEPCDI